MSHHTSTPIADTTSAVGTSGEDVNTPHHFSEEAPTVR